MAIKSVAVLKTFFETGDKPTQQQFWDFLDSYIHKDDGIAISDVSGLVTALNNKVDISVLANYAQLNKIMVYADVVDELATISHNDAAFVLIKNVGIFKAFVDAGGPDLSTNFPADTGWIWSLVMNAGIAIKGEYANNTDALADGLMPGDLYNLPMDTDNALVAVVKAAAEVARITEDGEERLTEDDELRIV